MPESRAPSLSRGVQGPRVGPNWFLESAESSASAEEFPLLGRPPRQQT